MTPAAGMAAVLLLAVPFHLRPENFIVDDGFFYPEIARHIVLGQGSTFNGIMLTNGYHPLWMFVCVIASFFTRKPTALVQILGALQDVILALSVATVLSIARAARLRGAFLGCLTFLLFNLVLGIWRLLEAPLALLMQISVLVLAVPVLPAIHQALRRWRVPLLGFLLGLTILTRLDLIFLALVILGYLLISPEDGAASVSARCARMLLAGTIATAVVAPYLFWNWRTFHHLLPISGAIKSTFPHVQSWAIQSFARPVVFAILLNFIGGAFRPKTPFNTLCLLTSITAALHLAYTLSFGELAPWYLTTGYLSVALCVTWITDTIIQHRPPLSRIELPLISTICIVFFVVGTLRSSTNLSFTRLVHGAVSLHGSYLEPKRALAQQLARTFPPGTRMYIFDAPGGVALYSGMSVLPVDGLVADYSYNKEVAQVGVTAYAANHDIRYFVGPRLAQGQDYNRLFLHGYRTSTGQAFSVEAPLMRRPAGTLNLPQKNLVFSFREINPELESRFPEIGVWRLEPPPPAEHNQAF